MQQTIEEDRNQQCQIRIAELESAVAKFSLAEEDRLIAMQQWRESQQQWENMLSEKRTTCDMTVLSDIAKLFIFCLNREMFPLSESITFV